MKSSWPKSSLAILLGLPIFTFSGFILSCILPGPLGLAQKKEEELKDNSHFMTLTKKKILATEQTQRHILNSLYLINQKMRDMSQHRDRITNRLLAVEADASTMARQIAQLESQQDKQKSSLKKRLRGLYLYSGPSTLRSVFSSQTPLEMERNLKALQYLTQHDYNLIRLYKNNLVKLQNQRQQLTQRIRHLQHLKIDFRSQEAKIYTEQSKKQKLLSELQGVRDFHLNELSKLRQKEKTSISFFEQKERLSSPVDGKLVKNFGYIQHPQYLFRLAHKGQFYSTPAATTVRGIFKGRVAFAGELPGYGNTLILDHGDHYYTVYSYLTSLSVKKDDVILSHQPIGTSGGLSSWFGPGLYFEIRHFSDAIDPASWLKGPQSMKTSQL